MEQSEKMSGEVGGRGFLPLLDLRDLMDLKPESSSGLLSLFPVPDPEPWLPGVIWFNPPHSAETDPPSGEAKSGENDRLEPGETG